MEMASLRTFHIIALIKDWQLLAYLSKGGSGVVWPRLSQSRLSYECVKFLCPHLFKCWLSSQSSAISSALVSLPLCPGCVSWLSEHLFFIPFLFLAQCQQMSICANC